MRRAIYEAEVGDDVFSDDPTVNRLQEMAAEITGKEAGLLVSSGTQGNLIAQLVHCPRGAEVIIGEGSHIIEHEGGGAKKGCRDEQGHCRRCRQRGQPQHIARRILEITDQSLKHGHASI